MLLRRPAGTELGLRRAGPGAIASYRRWAARYLCTPATPTFSERIGKTIEQAAASAPAAKFSDVRKRGGSLGDAIAAMREKNEDEEKDGAFYNMAQALIKLPKFTMAEFRDVLQQALDKQEAGMTFLTKARLKLDTVRGGSHEKMLEVQKEKIKTQIKIINQMTPCEVDRPALIGYREHERIAQALELESYRPICDVLEEQEVQAMQRQWTIREVLQGRSVPLTNEEMRIRMGTWPTKWYVKIMRRIQIKRMTYKQRRKLFMYNGKRNKQGKETPKWK
jgi:hypothetical protein